MRKAIATLLRRAVAPVRPSRQPRRQRGFIMIEALVVLALVGSATAATLTSVSTGSLITSRASAHATADWIATSQANLIQEAVFAPTPGQYAVVETPDGFTVTNTTAAFPGGDDAIQTVTITVRHDGVPLLTTEVIRVDR